MKKLILSVTIILLVATAAAQASPLNDFTPGRAAVDILWHPHTFEGNNAFEGGVTVGLGGKWAVNYRQLGYDADGPGGDWRTQNREINLVHKLRKDIQLYIGYSRTTGDGFHGSADLPAKGVAQAGAILSRKLGERTVLYAVLGGGDNVTNIECGLSYLVSPGLELTTTYRHLTVEKVGPARAKENFRGFGAGLTFKF